MVVKVKRDHELNHQNKQKVTMYHHESASRAGSSSYCSALIAEQLGSDQQRVKPTRASFARPPSQVVAQDAVAQGHARRWEEKVVPQNLLAGRGPRILTS